MVRTVNAFLIAVWLLFAVEANAITGNDWRRLPLAAQHYYIIGVLDGWDNLGTIALLAKQPLSVVTRLAEHIKCTAEMPYEQIVAIVQKYMDNNPSQWHYDMASLTWNAVNEACAPASK